MPILKNVKHECFARAVAEGHSVFKAHGIAGFSADRANAGRLRHRDDIGRRIDEILASRTQAFDQTTATAAEKAGVSTYWVIRQLRTNATMAMRQGDRSAANKAIELIGRYFNMFIDKKNVEINSLDDADQYLQRIIALVDGEAVEHEPAPLAMGQGPAEPDENLH